MNTPVNGYDNLTDEEVGDAIVVTLLENCDDDPEAIIEDFLENEVEIETGYPDNNPKTVLGSKKPALHAIPPVALLVLGQGMSNGEAKYGLMNWRENNVAVSVYYDAMMRHLMAFWDGEDIAEDSQVHHLGHVMSCCAIVLDAIVGDNIIDDRPTPGGTSRLIEELTQTDDDEESEWRHPTFEELAHYLGLDTSEEEEGDLATNLLEMAEPGESAGVTLGRFVDKCLVQAANDPDYDGRPLTMTIDVARIISGAG